MPDPLTPTQRFARCLDEVLRHEGGYVDHPRDPGGATNLGITRKTLASWREVTPWWNVPKSDVAALRRDEAAAIYQTRFWNRVEGGSLPGGIDLALFDYAVNSGPERPIKALQTHLKVTVDGWLGPQTLKALKLHIAAAGTAGLIVALCNGRLNFLERLAIYAVFGKGWSRRVSEIRAAALAMAGTTEPHSQPSQRTDPMNILSGYKTYIVATSMIIFAVAQLLGVDIPAMDGGAPGQLLMQALALIFLRQGVKADISKA